jgi:hypothetical protein
MKQGKITPNGVVLHTYENATVVFLTEQGFNVELLPPIQLKGARTPDIRMHKLEWEIKCPTGKSTPKCLIKPISQNWKKNFRH